MGAKTSSTSSFEACLSAFQWIDRNVDLFIEDLIRICEVPAPTFREEKRGKFVASLFKNLGLAGRFDSVGNLIVPFCKNGSPHIVLSAHLDTVFSFEEIHVKREKGLLKAPGISDDSAGLAALLHIARALKKSFPNLPGTLTFVATVGEEGLGNLRGVKHFFSEHAKHVDGFVSLDGCDAERLVTTGPASKRSRLFLRGPGGHSWGDSGIANPIHACGDLLSKINRYHLPKKPKTVINVGIIGGGTSVNAIPTEVFLDIDMRSESEDALRKIDQFVADTLADITDRQPTLSSEIRVLGQRPSGRIATDHPLVQAALAASRQMGLAAKLDVGSTDSNIPFSLGIPALTVGVGGKSGKIHTPEEWLDPADIERGIKRTTLLIVELLHTLHR
ncbi:MAG TPA: M20/M25/M40 family metallo-hydrolase [Acidobacteriota bacterium]|nr:M20/M25/M40 family metallo-hydrolase [Acidobacteriota bacterium]